MNFFDDLIISNSDAISLFGTAAIVFFFGIGVVLIAVSLVFRNTIKTLPSQKKRTAFAKYYSNEQIYTDIDNGLEKRNFSMAGRSVMSAPVRTARRTAGGPGNHVTKQQRPHNEYDIRQRFPEAEFYFEFNEGYYFEDK